MAELPELRTIANTNGGSTTMLINRPRSNSSEGVFVPGPDPLRKQTGLPRAAGANSAGRFPAQWTSLDSDDRKVFNVWARWVAAFYASLVASLLVAIVVGARMPAGQRPGSAPSATQHSSLDLSAPTTRSAAK